MRAIRSRRLPKKARAPLTWLRCLVGVLVLTVFVGSAPAATARSAAVPANTELPEVIGTVKQGSTMAASTGTWTGTAPITFRYQWQRCDASGSSCVALEGAELPTYAVGAGDVGAALRVAVVAANAEGSSGAVSPATPLVASSPEGSPMNTVPPRVSGGASQGETLTVDSGTWSGTAPIAFAYAWLRCEEDAGDCLTIAGADDETYTLVSADAGRTLRAVVAASNGAGSNSAVSVATARVATASAPSNTSPPTISGTAAVGQTLSASSGTWAGATPITFAFQWRRCNASSGDCANIAGATGSTYTLSSADAGRTLRVLVTASNAVGTASAVAAATAVVEALSAPRIVTAPRISGTPTQGQSLTADPGTWAGGPSEFAFQWQRCNANGGGCGDIGGAAGRSYKLRVEDVNRRLRVRVTASNSLGRAIAFSGLTSTVAPSVPENLSAPRISGTLQVGSSLTASPGIWASYTPIRFTFQWVRCGRQFVFSECRPIPGATRARYRLTQADFGRRLFVQVKAQNSVGPRFVNSLPTEVVGSGAPAPPSGAVPVSQVALPNRLVIDRIQFIPRRIRSRAEPLVLRVHVSETSGRRPVSGALVKAIGVPFNRLSAAPEVQTGADGWAQITFRVRAGFRLVRGELLVVFVRARKPGGSVLAGVSTRRLVSVRVG